MVKIKFVLLFALLVATPLLAQRNPIFDYVKMYDFLHNLNDRNQDKQSIEMKDLTLLPLKVPSFILARLDRLNAKFSLGDAIRIDKEQNSLMAALFSRDQVCMSKNAVQKIQSAFGQDSQRLIEYIVTHEYAHFIHELSTDKVGRSINGNISAYRFDMKSYIEQMLRIDFSDPSSLTESKMAQVPNIELRLFHMSQLSHSEVDGYTDLIYKSLKEALPAKPRATQISIPQVPKSCKEKTSEGLGIRLLFFCGRGLLAFTGSDFKAIANLSRKEGFTQPTRLKQR